MKWLKKVGDKVSSGEILFEVETDKATVGYEVQDDGYLAKILVPEGSMEVKVGQQVAIIVDSQDQVQKFDSYQEGNQ